MSDIVLVALITTAGAIVAATITARNQKKKK
jgi:hypothetical protein